MKEQMQVEFVPIAEVIPYHRNPRNNAEAVAGVARSIKDFGWNQPIVVDKKNVIIVGDTRFRAAHSLGLKTVPRVVAQLTAAKAKAYRIADNKVGEVATWDDGLLKLELADLMADDGAVELTTEFVGIDRADLMTLLDRDDAQGDLINGSSADQVAPTDYGGATALQRGSAPFRYWREHDRLKGQVLDFGAGKEQHDHARYDIVHAPDIVPLLGQYDTVVCNHVLNCQPTDHLVDLVLALLVHLTKSNGTCLIAVQNRKAASSKSTAGTRINRTATEWTETISRFFQVTKVDASFIGFVCKRK